MNWESEKSSEELKEFKPFKSKYLEHKPKIECSKDDFTIDDLTLSWEDGISVSIGEVEVSVDLGESSVTVKEGDNEISFGSDGVTLHGEYEGKTGTFINVVSIGEDGLSMGGEEAYVNINADGLSTGSSHKGHPDNKNELKITSEGLFFDGTGDAKLTLGEEFEYSPLDLFKPKFGTPFEVNSTPLSLSLSSTDLELNVLQETNIAINKAPSCNITSCGCRISLNEGSPISISIGEAVVFEFTGSSLLLNMSGVDITFEDGSLKIDNDVVACSIGKSGPSFTTYGVPFDLKAYKDQLKFPEFNFKLPEIKIPGIPGLPSIPKPGGLPDIGGCCSIF